MWPKRTEDLGPIIMGFNLKTRWDERPSKRQLRGATSWRRGSTFEVYYLNTCTAIGISFLNHHHHLHLLLLRFYRSFAYTFRSLHCWLMWSCVSNLLDRRFLLRWSGFFKAQKKNGMMDIEGTCRHHTARSLSTREPTATGMTRRNRTGRHETRSKTKGNTGAAGYIFNGVLLIIHMILLFVTSPFYLSSSPIS